MLTITRSASSVAENTQTPTSEQTLPLLGAMQIPPLYLYQSKN